MKQYTVEQLMALSALLGLLCSTPYKVSANPRFLETHAKLLECNSMGRNIDELENEMIEHAIDIVLNIE